MVEVNIYNTLVVIVENMYLKNREQLVKKLVLESNIKNEIIKKAFLTVKREKFLPDHQKIHAYNDRPLEIGNGQTISAPHMVAIMCESLDIHKGQKILEIGAGSGYHAAIVAQLVGEKGVDKEYCPHCICSLSRGLLTQLLLLEMVLRGFLTMHHMIVSMSLVQHHLSLNHLLTN